MMHRNQAVYDSFETLCSIKALIVRRYRMKRTRELRDLATNGNEALVVAMAGKAKLDSKSLPMPVTLGEKDICYLPRGDKFGLRKLSDECDIVMAYAPATRRFKPYVKRFSETKPVGSGGEAYHREIYNMVVENDPGERFLGGFVESAQGNWTSFPPHKHDGKPEVYIYYGMGERFGVQTVITEQKDMAYVVREGDAVLFEKGYHSNVAAPGTGMNFLWIISADPKARDLSVEFHPAFKGLPVGKTHLKLD